MFPTRGTATTGTAHAAASRADLDNSRPRFIVGLRRRAH